MAKLKNFPYQAGTLGRQEGGSKAVLGVGTVITQ